MKPIPTTYLKTSNIAGMFEAPMYLSFPPRGKCYSEFGVYRSHAFLYVVTPLPLFLCDTNLDPKGMQSFFGLWGRPLGVMCREKIRC